MRRSSPARQLLSNTPSELEKLGIPPIVIKTIVEHLAQFGLTLAPETAVIATM
jgi:hypothetical protein